MNQYIQALVERGASAAYASGRVEMLTELAQRATVAGSGTADFTALARWAEEELVPVFELFCLRSESNLNMVAGRNRQDKFNRIEYQCEI